MIISSTQNHSDRPAAQPRGVAVARSLAVPQPKALPLHPQPQARPLAGDISLARRMRDWKTLVGFGVSAATIAFFVLTAHLDIGAAWANITRADLRFLALALLVYLSAFLFRGLRWRLLLRRADLGANVQLPPLAGLVEFIYLSWFVNCIVPAKLGDAYRAYLLNKHTGASMEKTLGTVVGERMADVLALAVLLCTSGLLIISSLAGAAANLQTILMIGLLLSVTIGVVLVAARPASRFLVAHAPARWRDRLARFADGLLRTFRRDVQLPLYALTCLVWSFEVLRIWLVLQSFHITGLAPGVIIFTALAGSLLSTIPFTPAGLGAVEGATMAILTAFGLTTGMAASVAILDRVINYWSNIPIGGLVYLFSRRK